MAATNLEKNLIESIGPILFRLVWWNHLDPTKRDDFGEDLFDLIIDGVIKCFEIDEDTTVPPGLEEIAKAIVRQFLDSRIGGFAKHIGTFGDDTFENVTLKLLAFRDESEFHRQFAAYYDVFISRIANLSDPLISAVKLINEEFIIWLKTHPDHTQKIHSDAFEQLTGEILTSHGFSIEFTGRIKNKSADLLAIEKNENGEDVKYLIECKRYSNSNKVDLHILNAVIGASFRAKLNHAMLVTTSSFTANTKQAKAELEDFRLDLHDGNKVTEWLSDYQFKNYGLWLPQGWQDEWTSSV